jgi:predicted NUDIX family NTP pyrophosphohydrolase
MTRNLAAGLLMCRAFNNILQYFLVHPGGPYFKNKDLGIWSIPKGIPEEGEDLSETARREFFEETGIKPAPPYFDIGTVKQKGGKVVHAWAFAGTWDPETGITCNNFSLEWPPRSGKKVEFPEVDKARWMDHTEATTLIIPEQILFLERARNIFTPLPDLK